MSGTATPLAERQPVLAACVEVLTDLHTVLHQCPNGDLAALLGVLGDLNAFSAAHAAAVVAEAEQRGIIAESQCASTAGWIAEHSWHLRRQACTLAKAAAALRKPDLADLADSVLTADVDLPTAVTVADEYHRLAADLRDEAKPVVLRQMLNVGADHGPGGVRKLKQEILARYGADGDFDKHQQRCRRQIDLSSGRELSPGVWHYEFVADNHARAVLEAAIGPLSAPSPPCDTDGRPTGEPDPRTAGRRRGDALVEMLSRGVTNTKAAAQAGHPSASAKAVLMVTIDFDSLQAQVGAGTTLGPRGEGLLLAPEVVRRLACNAGIIPVVLGGGGDVLNQGREQRLFTVEQVRALTRRDRHCTYPGCHNPATWTDAHHLRHWVDGGATDVANGALLCARHHTVVHRDRLAGRINNHGQVEWDTRCGSYETTPSMVRRT